jgi:peroxiredoxin
MTLQTLSGSGVELLIRPQIRAQLIARIDKVEFVGDETLSGQAVAHSRLTLDDGKLLDVWFTKQTKPLLLQLATTERIPVSAKQTIELLTTSKFAWKVGGPLPDSTFSVTIPADARQVDDLLAALRDGDMRQLLGKPAPLLELANLNGQPVRLADYRGKNVVVLIFWASWCAPSTNSMDTLNTFVTEAERNGAVVLAINLGETLQQVKAAIQERQYRGTVLLDPETKSLDAYRFGELPMTVMIGKDGTVQSFQSGSTATARERIRLDTATLLQGKSLIPAGVR